MLLRLVLPLPTHPHSCCDLLQCLSIQQKCLTCQGELRCMQSVKGVNRQAVDERYQAAIAAAAAAAGEAEQSGASMHPDELDKAALQRVRLQ